MKIILLSLIPFILFSQQAVETETDSAFINAKKGIYYTLSNLDSSRNRTDHELIAENKLYAAVKLSKEIDGVKIESTGFYNSTEVLIKIYFSDDFLERQGYLKKVQPEESGTKRKKKS